MELIKRRILLEDGISRFPDATYGLLTATSFYLKVELTQNMDDMGIFTDAPYIPYSQGADPDYTILINKLNESGYTFSFMTGGLPANVPLTGFTKCLRPSGADVSDWYKTSGTVTGFTDTKLETSKSYNINNPFIVNFDTNAETYINYTGSSIDGRTRVTSLADPITYVVDANNDSNIGTTNQISGILYQDFSGQTRSVFYDGLFRVVDSTTFQIFGEGWNPTNTSLSALTKEEYLLGIVSPPEVQSDVFIDRGTTTVLESHLMLSEIESLEHLENYGNGIYNVIRQ